MNTIRSIGSSQLRHAPLKYPRYTCLRLASSQTASFRDNRPSKPRNDKIDFSKYPSVKPNPHAQDRYIRPPPLPYRSDVHLPARGGPPVPDLPEKTHRKVRKQMTGALALFLVTVVTYQLLVQPMLMDAPKDSVDAMKGRQVVIVKETTVGGETVDTVESGTSHVKPLPTRIFLPTKVSAGVSDISGVKASEVLEEYTLVGHGIRTVSFLSVQVYVVALYVATSSLPKLQRALLHTLDIPTSATTATLPEREALRKKLLDENQGIEVIDQILDLKGDSGVKMVMRIIPTRNTDYPHLRDGWVRGITAKTNIKPERYDDEQFIDSLTKFKSLFGGKNSVPKGNVMLLSRDENGRLIAYGPDENQKDVISLAEGGKKHTAMHGLKLLGGVDDERISRTLWLCYWAGKKVASEGARKSVVEGLVDIVARPVGSTEGKVV